MKAKPQTKEIGLPTGGEWEKGRKKQVQEWDGGIRRG